MAKSHVTHLPLTVEILKATLAYDPATGDFTWLKSQYRPMNVGKVAGWRDQHGYRNIEVYGKRYKGARLAWFYTHGVWPKDEIDHIDRDPTNDRIENLREATRTQNVINRTRVRKSDLPRGVDRNKKGFLARIRLNGHVRCLGTYKTPEEAGAVYQAAAEKLFGEFLPER